MEIEATLIKLSAKCQMSSLLISLSWDKIHKAVRMKKRNNLYHPKQTKNLSKRVDSAKSPTTSVLYSVDMR